ncbi:hypothetical protein BP5796_04309 [Coleophoma crateriformis]|uniref:NAD(P)-binding protein n=1 Tax=Coleophoma crateriformis TaxID=565419 RepID=A0A3D8SIH7_9HELO|nr:hypothetical protein BP5796_04309 [Coleophoma crateriformis]
MTPIQEPIEYDKISYDAPLSFPEPSPKWTQEMGKSAKTTHFEFISSKDLPSADLSGKWVLITGSNNGIGREAALDFARMGANLILACREPPPTEKDPESVVSECKAEAKKANHDSTIEWWKYNAAELDSVEALAQRWLETDRALDILCNNAGLGTSPGGPDVFMTKDGFEIIHQEVNFLSHVLLTLRLLPSLAKAEMPRIVCTTSCFHYLGKYDISNFNGGPGLGGPGGAQYYKNNKLYFQIWLTELQQRFLQQDAYKHITVNGIHPGFVNSGVWNSNWKASWVAKVTQIVIKTIVYFVAISPQQGSLAIRYAALAPECGPDPTVQGVGDSRGKGGGRYFNRIWEEESMPHCRDGDTRLRVWRKVDEELKLRDKGLLGAQGQLPESIRE